MQQLENFSTQPQEICTAAIARTIQLDRDGPLEPKIVLRGREALKLKAIRLHGKKLSLEIGLLRLSHSGANSAVGAFTSLAKAEVPKLIKK